MSTRNELTSDDLRTLEHAVNRRIQEVRFHITEIERDPNSTEARRQGCYTELHELNDAIQKVRTMANQAGV